MSAVGYYQLGELVESNIINSLCDGGVGYPIDRRIIRYYTGWDVPAT
jgi:hypothetical protein